MEMHGERIGDVVGTDSGQIRDRLGTDWGQIGDTFGMYWGHLGCLKKDAERIKRT